MNKTDKLRGNALPYTKAGLFQPMEELEVWFAVGAQQIKNEFRWNEAAYS